MGREPAVLPGRRRAHALRGRLLHALLRQRLDDRGRQRLCDRPRPFPVRAGRLDRPLFSDRRGRGLWRSRPGLAADRRLHRDDQLPQPLPRHGEEWPRHAERRASRRAMDASLQRQYRGQRHRGGRLRVRGRRQRCNERLRLRPDRAERDCQHDLDGVGRAPRLPLQQPGGDRRFRRRHGVRPNRDDGARRRRPAL